MFKRIVLFLLATAFVYFGASLFGGEKSPSQPFWNSLLKLGGKKGGSQEEKKALKSMEEIIRYTKAALYNYEYGEEARAYKKTYDRQMSSFDVKDIYDKLPFEQEDSKWKGSHHWERRKKGKILVQLLEPDIEKWLKMPNRETHAPWKKVEKLGESDQRFYISPKANPRGGDTHYMAYTFERMGLGPIAPTHILYALEELLTYMEKGVRNAPSTFPGADKLAQRFPKLTSAERYVVWKFSQDMPSLYKEVMKYIDLQSISTPLQHKGVDYCRFNLKISLKMKGIKKDFPKIYKYLKKIRGLFDLKSRMYNKDGHFVGFLFFSTTNYTFHFSYCLKNGRFLPCSVPWEPITFKSFSFLDKGQQKNVFRNDIRIRVNGIKMVLRNILLKQVYTHGKKKSELKFQLDETPIIQKIEGRAYGIVPIWMIDLLIPSNVEELMKEFFTTLAKGRGGKGWEMVIRASSENGFNRVEMGIASEVLSNGIIQMGLKIVAELLTPDEETAQEFNEFSKTFWHAFVSDYFKYRYR